MIVCTLNTYNVYCSGYWAGAFSYIYWTTARKLKINFTEDGKQRNKNKIWYLIIEGYVYTIFKDYVDFLVILTQKDLKSICKGIKDPLREI